MWVAAGVGASVALCRWQARGLWDSALRRAPHPGRVVAGAARPAALAA